MVSSGKGGQCGILQQGEVFVRWTQIHLVNNIKEGTGGEKVLLPLILFMFWKLHRLCN